MKIITNKKPALKAFLIILTGFYSTVFIDIKILLLGFSLFLIGFLIKKNDIVLLFLLFFSAGIYQKSRTPEIGRRIHFQGICIDNRIIDPLWGELYSRLPVNSGNFIKGSGIFVKDIGFSKIVGVKIKESSPTILTPLFNFRISLEEKIKRRLPGNIGEICSAITLGIRKSLPPKTHKRFQSCGAAHLLAVSGLHTGIVFAVIFVLLKASQLKRNSALLIAVFFVLFYAVFTGLRLPTLRASIMLLFFVIGELRERSIDPFNILSSAGILIILLMPRSIFGISFQLSFIAVFSILIMFNLLKDYFEKIPNRWFKQWLILPFFITLSAQLGTMPIVAYYFGYIPLIGLIANLILIPLTATLISGCLLFLALPFANKIIGNFVWLTGLSMNKIMMTIEKIPYAVIKIQKNEPLILLVYLVYLTLLLIYIRFKRKDNKLYFPSSISVKTVTCSSWPPE